MVGGGPGRTRRHRSPVGFDPRVHPADYEPQNLRQSHDAIASHSSREELVGTAQRRDRFAGKPARGYRFRAFGVCRCRRQPDDRCASGRPRNRAWRSTRLDGQRFCAISQVALVQSRRTPIAVCYTDVSNGCRPSPPSSPYDVRSTGASLNCFRNLSERTPAG